MKIVVDTNIIFSALLNSDGLIGDLLFNSYGILFFIAVIICKRKSKSINYLIKVLNKKISPGYLIVLNFYHCDYPSVEKSLEIILARHGNESNGFYYFILHMITSFSYRYIPLIRVTKIITMKISGHRYPFRCVAASLRERSFPTIASLPILSGLRESLRCAAASPREPSLCAFTAPAAVAASRAHTLPIHS